MRFKFPSIFSARCFTFKTISFSHCWRLLSLDMRPTCSAPPSIIHFPLCPGLLAPTRSPNAVLLAPLYRTTTSGKFLRLKTRYNGTSRPPRRALRIAAYEINQAVRIAFCPSFKCASWRATLYDIASPLTI